MATANDQLHDALLRRQLQLILFSNGLSADVIKAIDETEAEVRDLLNKRLAVIVGSGGVDFGPDTTKRLKLLEQALRDIRSNGFTAGKEVMSDTLKQMANDEASFVDRVVRNVAPVTLDTIIPAAGTLGALVSSEPFQGAVMSEWASRLADDDTQRIMNTIRLGMAQGDDAATISRDVFGLESLNGADGTVEMTRQQAASIARTAVTAISNDARSEYFKANDDVFEEEVYVATLDSHTTPLCRSLDGNIYKIGEGPIPGKTTHWGCRSVRVALISSGLIGNRPAAAYTDSDLAGLSKADRSAKIRELTGQVPAATTYQDWLSNQSAAFQDSILGRSRGRLFRDGGLDLKSFVNTRTGTQWSLDELKRREPEAFGAVAD